LTKSYKTTFFGSKTKSISNFDLIDRACTGSGKQVKRIRSDWY